ncbi:MAG: hypothetical protein WD512_17675, partial [Candidatus Paceibacterota bacterium]
RPFRSFEEEEVIHTVEKAANKFGIKFDQSNINIESYVSRLNSSSTANCGSQINIAVVNFIIIDGDVKKNNVTINYHRNEIE